MKIVLDTNVVLDWLHFHDPGVQPLVRAIDDATVQLVACADCLEELRQVLSRTRFGLDPAIQAEMMKQYETQAHLCRGAGGEPAARLPVCRDADDQKFLALASRAGAAYLLTKDKALLKLSSRALKQAGFAVLTPLAFISRVLQQSSARR